MLLLGSVELRNVNPQVFLSTLDLLRTTLTCTFLWAHVNPELTSVYYYPPQTLLPAPAPLNSTLNCTELNATQSGIRGDAQVAAWYTFENSTDIMNMNIIQFNTMVSHSPFMLDYKRILGTSVLFAAGPVELLHLPGPIQVPVLPTNSCSDSWSRLSLLVLLAHMAAALYIAAAAGA